MQVLDMATRQALDHLRRADEYLNVARSVKEARSEEERLLRSMTDEYREADGFRAITDGRSLAVEAPKVAAVSEALARAYGVTPRPGGFYVPVNVRTLTVGTAADGGNLVGSSLQFFVDAYREASLIRALRLPELSTRANATGVTISTKTTSYWLTNETTQITAAAPDVGTVTTAPKTVGAYTEASRQLVLQAGNEGLGLVYRELAGSLAEAADAALLAGAGTGGEPTGLVNVSGIGTGTGASFDLAAACDMLGTLEAAHGIRDRSRVAWVTDPASAELLRQREAAAGSGFLIDSAGRMLGIPVFVSASAPAATLALGDWSGVTVVSYAPLELATNPYAASVGDYRAGVVGIRAMLSLDLAFTRPASFVVAESVS